jgi:PAS domain S-box-containing protein
MKILLLEDNANDAALSVRAIRTVFQGCSIEHAPTIRDAFQLLEQNHHFDIALLDMQLPDGNGMDVLMKIRNSGMNMAVAMLTGSGDEEVAVAALKSGADDYMVKHHGYTDRLPQTIEYAIASHRQLVKSESVIIRVLFVEHNLTDVDLTSRHLARYAPFIQLDNVFSGEDALERLPAQLSPSEKCSYDLILMDYRLPGMSALEFIKTIRQLRKLDIPIIIVTGQGNEEVAVQALKLGASEYLMKRENYLSRLPSLIQNAFQHCELKRKQDELARSEAQYRLLAENSGDMIFTLDFDLNYTYVSPAIKALRGFTPEEVMQKKISDALTPSSLKIVKSIFEKVLPKIKSGNISLNPIVVELEMYKKDGSTGWFEVKVSVSSDEKGNPNGILGISRDISDKKRAQEELRKLSRAVTQSPDSIIITDKDGKIEYVNPKFTELTGYEKEEVLGKNPRILKSGEHPKSFYKELWDTILSGNDWKGEFRNKKKSGDLYWENASISPLVNESGEITHFVEVKEDISERKQTEELLKYHSELQHILLKIASKYINIQPDELEDSIFESLAEMGKFAGADRVYIFDYNWDKQITTNTHEWCAEGIGSQIENLKNVPMEMTLEWIETHKKGEVTFVPDVSALPFESGLRAVLEPQEIKSIISIPMMDGKNCIGFVGFDWVKKQHEYSEEGKLLLSLYTQMLVNVKTRIKLEENLFTEKEKAQAADRLKTAFLNNISHEVRTPLNGILGFGELLAQPGLSDDEKSSYFDILRQSSDRLVNTITDFMDISLITSGNMKADIKQVSVSDLFSKLSEPFETSCYRKGLVPVIQMENSRQIYFNTDAELLVKVFRHILDNAVKFTSNGQITFGCRAGWETIEFFVNDTGKGIDAEMQKNVFNHFVQEDSRNIRGHEGSGLGLSIAKGLVELMGGTIALDSEKERGTKVTLTFPLNAAGTAPVHEKPVPVSVSAVTKVLVVDDDDVNRIYLETILKRLGLKTVSAVNGKDAIRQYAENTDVAIVFMDLKMPVMDGFEATRQIKKLNPSLPVIAVTAYAMKGDAQLAHDAGCDDYLVKPFTREMLKLKFEKYLVTPDE